MAGIGLRYFAWAKMATEPDNAKPTYEKGFALAKGVSAELAITNAEGKLCADDEIAEEVSEFSYADLTLQGDHLELQDQATVYGADYSNDELGFSGEDTAPYGGFGFVQAVSKNNVKKYRAFLFTKGKAKRPNETINTKGDSITFATAPLNLTIIQPKFGKWERVKEFTTFDAAKAWLDAELNVSEWYEINVQAQGTGSGKNVSPVGVSMAASGTSFELTIQGYASVTAAYDNGEDVTATVTGGSGKYTISSVTEKHDIVIVF